MVEAGIMHDAFLLRSVMGQSRNDKLHSGDDNLKGLVTLRET